MAKSKSKQEVTENVSWTVEATIIGEDGQAVEKAIEAIEAILDNAADDVMDVAIDEFSVRMN